MNSVPGPASGGHMAAFGTRNRIAVMHGVNLDQLGRRPAGHYGTLTLMQLETRIADWGAELDLSVQFFQTNHEGQFVEELHRLEDTVDALILNPGAWTHYSWAIRDALEIAGLPAVEVHLSDVEAREEWRRRSVIRELCVATVAGRGPDGYREALELLREAAERDRAARADRLAALLDERELDALLVTNLVNVRYLTGYTGTNGVALVGVRDLRCFVTDFRYVTQAEQQVHGFERRIGEQDLLDDAVAALPDGDMRLGIEDQHMAVRTFDRLREALPDSVELVPAGGIVERLRERKDADEVARIRAAAELADAALQRTLEDGLAGRTERAVALALEQEMRRLGAERPSFDTIVASGAHGALPHAVPARRRDRAGLPRDDRLGRAARRLLLGLHAHVRGRRAGRARARGLRAGAARAACRARRGARRA